MRRFILLGTALAIIGGCLAGCGGSKKIVMRINDDVVTEDEFYQRVEDVNAVDLAPALQGNGAGKAGEFAVQSIIFEKLILQMAKQKKCLPTEAQIDDFMTFSKKYPRLAGNFAQSGFYTDKEIRSTVRVLLAQQNLAMAPLNITEADLQKLYEQQKMQLSPGEQAHLRIIEISDKAKADQVADVLKKQVPFDTVALKWSDDPKSREKNGDVGFVPIAGLPAQIADAIKNLKPNEYTPTPVKMDGMSQSTGKMQPNYYFIQVIERKNDPPPTFNDIRPFIVMMAIKNRDSNFQARIQKMKRDALISAKIEIKLKQYEQMVANLKQMASKEETAPAVNKPASAP